MVSQIVLTVTALLCVLSIAGSTTNAYETPYLCEPALLESRPNHIKKVCLALENSHDLTNQINAFLKSQEPNYRNYDFSILPDSNNNDEMHRKRSDVDHLFLRFGRRR